jgi:hypothetical protein
MSKISLELAVLQEACQSISLLIINEIGYFYIPARQFFVCPATSASSQLLFCQHQAATLASEASW